jgi:hypothetical protein
VQKPRYTISHAPVSLYVWDIRSAHPGPASPEVDVHQAASSVVSTEEDSVPPHCEELACIGDTL